MMKSKWSLWSLSYTQPLWSKISRFLTIFKGIEILHEPKRIIVTQGKFALDHLTKFDTSDVSSYLCHLLTHLQLLVNEGHVLSYPMQYQILMGKLSNLIHIRLNWFRFCSSIRKPIYAWSTRSTLGSNIFILFAL